MKSSEFLTEHSDYAQERDYTPKLLEDIKQMCLAARQIAAERGINLVYTHHFFKQMTLRRGIYGVYTKEDLMSALGKIVARGTKFFDNKPSQYSLAFHDNRTNIIIEMVKDNDNTFVARSTIRDYKWHGSSPMISL
jgi:hypothetical protein